MILLFYEQYSLITSFPATAETTNRHLHTHTIVNQKFITL